jgi:phosphohistidine phosphatase
MLELMLLRHAKAKRPDGVEDFDRKLSGRGREAATALGKLLQRERLEPELVLVSSSRRTRQTWERIADELGTPIPARELRTLYLAGPAKILEQVRKASDGTRRVMVVGHNPGIGALASRLTGAELEFPTCAMALIEFDAARWADIERGRLARYID